MKKERTKIYLGTLITFFLAAIFIIPFALVFINSVKENGDFLENPFRLPTELRWNNYVNAIEKMNFLNSFKNSMILVIGVTVFVLLLGSMAAYVITRKPWRINKIIYSVLIAAMAVPFQVIMIPLVKIYGNILGLNNNLGAVIYIMIGCNLPFSIFLFSGFINRVPVELDEAALIDGASPERTFFAIIFPLLKPITMTCAVFNALGIWNDYLLSSTFLSTAAVKTLPLMTYSFLNERSADYTSMMAGLVLALIPILIFYLCAQKYVIEGVVAGSVKG